MAQSVPDYGAMAFVPGRGGGMAPLPGGGAGAGAGAGGDPLPGAMVPSSPGASPHGSQVSRLSGGGGGGGGGRRGGAAGSSGRGSTTMTATGGLSAAAKPERPSNRAGLAVALFITFLASVCFAIVLPSINNFLEELKAPKSSVGPAVAVNSFGQFVASPLFGWWADKRSVREVLAATLIVMVGGNVMYSLSTNLYVLLVARFIVGVGAANYAVAQMYISYATTLDNRTLVMGLNSMANVLGFVVGPGLAAVATSVPKFQLGGEKDGVAFNDLTWPGYISAAMSLLAIFVLVFMREIPPEERAANMADADPDDDASLYLDPLDDPNLPYRGHVKGRYRGPRRDPATMIPQQRMPKTTSSSFTYGMLGGGAGSVKSLSQMFATIKHELEQDDDKDTVDGGDIQSSRRRGEAERLLPADDASSTSTRGGAGGAASEKGGVRGLVSKMSRKTVIAVSVCLWSYFAYTTGFTVFETIGTQYTKRDPALRWGVRMNSYLYGGLGLCIILALVLLQVVIAVTKASDRILVAICTAMCVAGYGLLLSYSPHEKAPFTDQYVDEWRFLTSLIIAGAGYAMATAVLFALYSKVLEGLDQGMMMGWLSAAGSIARIVGPLFAATVLNTAGPFWVFASVGALLATSLVSIIVFWKQLAPVTLDDDDDDDDDEDDDDDDDDEDDVASRDDDDGLHGAVARRGDGLTRAGDEL